jgi:hypothetical protein
VKYQFRVVGDFPPKKDGSQSMWGKRSELNRLIKLRQAAYEAFRGAAPLQENIQMILRVYVSKNDHLTGDLDNFITGVCDGLMAADDRSNIGSWSDPNLNHIHPNKPLAIKDDCCVVSISAEKITSGDAQPWYEVILEGE